MDSLNVLLVEDHPMVRLGLSLVFDKADDINLIADADDGQKAVNLALQLKPDVVLMDIGLPVLDGIQATQLIKQSNPDIKILIFTSRESEDDVFDSLTAGADGYIMKGANEQQLISAIKAVAEGTAWLDPAIARLVLSNIKRHQTLTPSSQNTLEVQNTQIKSSKNPYGLTNKELEVLALIVEGLNNYQIAEKLFVTLSTAKSHVHNILQKLYVSNRTQATIQAVKEGLV